MPWPWTRVPKLEPVDLTLHDPAFAAFFGVGANYAGVNVTEDAVLGVTAVFRAVSLISGTIASLPLHTYRDVTPTNRQRMTSFLSDDPGGPGGLTPYEWKQTVVAHLLLHGRAPLLHIKNQAGALIGLQPIHPSVCKVDPPRVNALGQRLAKTFTITMADGGRRTFTEGEDITEILGLTLDGWHGVSVLDYHRNPLGTHIAGDRAAANLFGNGLLVRGLVSPAEGEDVTEDDAEKIKAALDQKTAGWERAGELAFVNRKLNFTPWQMNARDAQFLESRQFQIEEVARIFGVPPFELMQTEKQTSWGTGIESQQRGLARGTLLGWTMRIEQRLSRLLSQPRFVEFDFTALERPTPEDEIRLLLDQVRGGLLTVDEARAIRNLPPLAGGDSDQGGATPDPAPADTEATA